MWILVVNAGSSSLKLRVLDPADAVVASSDLPTSGGPEGLASALRSFVGAAPDVDVAGHRVVHGGTSFPEATLLGADAERSLAALADLAPLHNPPSLAAIRALRALYPGLEQVACFDTSFHATLPARASTYAVPEEWYREHGVRRYGFHGTSHRFVAGKAASMLGRPATGLRLVTAHLGNGCSATAVRDGKSVDTTMGLTPLEGLVMGTRSGDVDPGLLAYLAGRTGRDVAALTHDLNFDSGLEALSGVGNDMRTVVVAAAGGDGRAQLALDVFVHRLCKAIAGLVVGLQRLDALVFTGGIGEHSVEVRSLVLDRLGFLGLAEDVEANADHGRRTGGRVSLPGPVLALVVPTDEELLIARDTAEVIAAG